MNNPYSVGIVGFGAVGKNLAELFPGAATYDPALGLTDRDAINAARFAFVCVPTPATDGGACDTSAVEASVGWIESEVIVIRSTVPPGTTERLAAATGKRLVFQPEFGPGETPDHPFRHPRDIDWAILGGPRDTTGEVARLYMRVFSSALRVAHTDARTAELTKYMENAFLAMKVAFCNEFFDIAGAMDVDYDDLRELWLMDPRIGRSHTWVHREDRGFGGHCLPKDLAAIIAAAHGAGHPPTILEAVRDANAALRAGPGTGG